MLSSSAIPVFREIADLYAAAGIDRKVPSGTFDLLPLHAGNDFRMALHAVGHHRRGFFQLTYLISNDGAHDVLLASSPDQVLNSGNYLHAAIEGQHGFTLLFKAGVLAHQLASPTNEFPFFYQPASIELEVPTHAREKLLPQFHALQAIASDGLPYHAQRFSGVLAALMYEVRILYEQIERALNAHRLCRQLACRFEEIVLQHFSTHHTVEEYARLLHVSADHLSAEVKKHTGRNASEIIAERLITEAEYLLTYTDLQVAQIADQIGFTEPTHFTRFFKRHVKEGPSEFRQRTQHSQKNPSTAEFTDARARRFA